MSIVLIYAELPYAIRAYHRENEDSSYTIFVNSRIAWEQQKAGILHEVAHIQSDDLHKEETADLLESMLHGNEREHDISDIEFFSRVV